MHSSSRSPGSAPRRFLGSLSLTVLVALCQALAAAVSAESKSTIRFTTDEGTWMSVSEHPSGEWIAFDLLGNIHRVRAAGGEAECLTCDVEQAVNYHPRFSPDGRSLAFISDRGGQNALWVADADGARPRLVFQDADSRIVEPTWSLDGRSIIAVRRLKTAMAFYRVLAEVWRFPLDRSAPEQLVASEGSQRQWPSLSPDNRYLYFHSFSSLGQLHQIQRLNLKSRKIDDVTERKALNLTYPTYAAPLGEIAPEISPDGRYMAFARRIPGGRLALGKALHEGRTALWLRDLSSGAERVVMDPITTDAMDFLYTHKTRQLPGYAWSRDGKSIVLSQGGKIRRLSIDTGEVSDIPFTVSIERQVSQQTRYVGKPDLSPEFSPKALRWPRRHPDGGMLAFEAAGRIHLWNFARGKPRPVISMSSVSQAMPEWSPDGAWLAFIAWNEEGQGAVWKVRPDGSGLRKLSAREGLYVNPAWSADGRSLMVSRFLMETARSGAARSLEDRWEVLLLDGEGGGESPPLRGSGPAASVSADGEWLLTKIVNRPQGDARALIGQVIPEARTVLLSTDLRGEGRKVLLALSGTAGEIAISPDARWAVIEQYRELYLLPVPASASATLTVGTSPETTRLTRDGGAYAHWASPDEVEYFSANEYRVTHVGTGKTESRTVPLKLARLQAKRSLLLKNATIFVGDPRLSVLRSADLHIREGRIACIGACREAKVDETIDLSGRFVIPGWVDVHAHQLNQPDDQLVAPKRSSSAAYLAYGTTTASDPGVESPILSKAISEMTEAGHIVGPRSLSQGDFIRCPGTAPGFDRILPIETLEDAREIVARNVRLGATLLKSYQLCTRTQRQLLTEAAREAKVGVTVEAQDLDFVLSGIIDGSTGWEHWLQYLPIYGDVAQFFGKSRAHYSGQIYQAGYPGAGSTEYWAGYRDWWADEKARRFQPWRLLATRKAPTGKPIERFSWPILSLGAAAIAEAGGYTPVGGHSELPGIDNHWEVWALAYGMGNARALRAASHDGAHFLGLEAEIGSLEVGKAADFVVLTADPLEDIHNTMAIQSVALRGVLRDAGTLDEIWPSATRYGSFPWVQEDLGRFDIR